MQSSYQVNIETHTVYCGAHEAADGRFRGRVIIYDGRTVHDPIVFQDESAETFQTTRAAKGWAEGLAAKWFRERSIEIAIRQ